MLADFFFNVNISENYELSSKPREQHRRKLHIGVSCQGNTCINLTQLSVKLSHRP
jgi:hypothetical protein